VANCNITILFYLDKSIIKYKVRYIETPISIKGMTNEIGHFKYHLKIGLSPMIKWKAKADIETLDAKNDYAKYEDRNISGEINAFNLAFHVGGGALYLLGGGSTAIIAELIYYNGILDITPDDENRNNDYNILAHQLMLRIGIQF